MTITPEPLEPEKSESRYFVKDSGACSCSSS
jgi:hypothetical protein